MNEIRAFIGHSFDSTDEQLVQTFLSYFDSVKLLLGNFSWVNARRAEPTDVAQKVLSLIQDKNTFIGICTKRERILPLRIGLASYRC